MTDNSASAASYYAISIAVSGLDIQAYLAQGIEDIIEEKEDFAFGHLGDVIHAFTGIVPDACILIGETSQDRRNNLLQILGYFLLHVAFSSCLFRRGGLLRTEPRAMEAAARPINPPFRA